MSFGVMLVEGIVGGFAPPTPKKIIQIQNLDEGATITQQTLVPESGNDYHMQSANVSTEELTSIGEKIKQILKELPTESPPGSEDIYGLDIAVRFASDDFEWINGGPAGCGGGESSVKVDAEQKEKFKKVVELVKGLGQQYAA